MFPIVAQRSMQIITTRSYDERLKTLENVRKAGISVCCGGIIGLGGMKKPGLRHFV
jgi:biotin synthase-like enzyme